MAAIDWHLIGDVVWESIVAGLAVVVLFSMVVYWSSRAAEARLKRENPAIYGALAGVCMLGFVAIVVFAITVILNKS